MADSAAFERACILLEERTEFSRLETRGTIRIALKRAGLEAASVRASELSVVARAVLTRELDARGIPDSKSVCERICDGLSQLHDSASDDSPEAVFSRLGERTQ